MNIKLFYLIPIFETQDLSVSISSEYSQDDPFTISIPCTNLVYTKNSLDSPVVYIPSLIYNPEDNQSIENFSVEKINDYLNLSLNTKDISIFQTQFDSKNNELLVFVQIPKQKPTFAQHLEAIQIQDNMTNPFFNHFSIGNLSQFKFDNLLVEDVVVDFLNIENFKNFNIQSAFLSYVEKATITAFLKHQGYLSPDFSTELKMAQPFASSFKNLYK